jgi:hypothetical protein
MLNDNKLYNYTIILMQLVHMKIFLRVELYYNTRCVCACKRSTSKKYST